jgi:altronate dehydratase
VLFYFFPFVALLAEASKLGPGAEQEVRDNITIMANGTNPLVHQKLITLINGFVEHKIEHGTDIEKEFYKTNFGHLTVEERAGHMTKRCMSKRPIVFYMSSDDYVLRNGKFVIVRYWLCTYDQ